MRGLWSRLHLKGELTTKAKLRARAFHPDPHYLYISYQFPFCGRAALGFPLLSWRTFIACAAAPYYLHGPIGMIWDHHNISDTG